MGLILHISNRMRTFVNLEYLINTTIKNIPIYSSDEYNSKYVRDLYKCCVSDALHILTAIFCEQNSQLYFVCSKWIIIYSHTVFERRRIPLFGSTVYCFFEEFSLLLSSVHTDLTWSLNYCIIIENAIGWNFSIINCIELDTVVLIIIDTCNEFKTYWKCQYDVFKAKIKLKKN